MLGHAPHGELASRANVSAQSASMHLSQLVAGGFLTVAREGRHRYYAIANRHIAHAIEALGTILTKPSVHPDEKDHDLRYARTCYDHLAGELGVRLTPALEQHRVLVPYSDREYRVTPSGARFLAGKLTRPRCGTGHSRDGILIGQRSATILPAFWEPQSAISSSNVAGLLGRRRPALFICRCMAGRELAKFLRVEPL
jgi:DNA-binding transcriptional ArsR family regulator